MQGSGATKHATAHGKTMQELYNEKTFILLGSIRYDLKGLKDNAQKEYVLLQQARQIIGSEVTVPKLRENWPYYDRCDRQIFKSRNMCFLDELRGINSPCVGWNSCPRRQYDPCRTHIVPHEELLMLTYNKYGEEFVPVTDLEEMGGVKVAELGHARIIVGRGSMFCPVPATWGHEVYLYINGKMWMSTGKDEKDSMAEAAELCRKNARCFVGGLGLGVVLLALAKKQPGLITVCEIDQDVIDLIWPRVTAWISKKYPDVKLEVIHGDAFVEVQKNGPYDLAFMDMWPDANHTDENMELVRKAELAANRNLTPNGKVVCWMKNRIMDINPPKQTIYIKRVLKELTA